MTTIRGKARSATETQTMHAHLRIRDLRLLRAGDSQMKRSDWQCSLCAQSFIGDSDQPEIPVCPACTRHLDAISDEKIKSYLHHWLRKGHSPEQLNSWHLTRVAS